MRVRRPLSVRSKLLASVALVGLLLAAVGAVVQSAFTSTVSNSGNSFQAGTVELTGNFDRESALFDLKGLAPGQGDTKCIALSYASTADIGAAVRMYGKSTGELAQHLHLEVTRGSFAGAAPGAGACTGFVPLETMFSAPLGHFPSTFATGARDADDSWVDGDSAAYRISVTLNGGDEAQGKSATHEFVFESRTE